MWLNVGAGSRYEFQPPVPGSGHSSPHDNALRYETFIEDQMRSPSALVADRGVTYWLFKGNIYSTTADLLAPDVQALVEAREQKQRRQVERAKAYVESAGASAGRREVVPDDVKMFVWQRDNGCCVRCGSNKELEFDHIIPVVMGGSNTARNLQLLCEPCNREKGGAP